MNEYDALVDLIRVAEESCVECDHMTKALSLRDLQTELRANPEISKQLQRGWQRNCGSNKLYSAAPAESSTTTTTTVMPDSDASRLICQRNERFTGTGFCLAGLRF
jgi:hypothetical protein